jgi:hypothetical protein
LECASDFGTHDRDAIDKYFTEHPERRPSVASEVTRSTSSTQRPYRFGVVQNFIFTTSEGISEISPQTVAVQVATANRLYTDWNYKFILAPTQTIKSDEYYNYNQLFVNDGDIKSQWNQPGVFNAYWFNQLCASPTECYCGYAYYPWYYLLQTAFLNGNCLGNVFAHEIGHNFGLLHTHQTPPAELVSGTNCATAGDEVCDTPADPNLSSKSTFRIIGDSTKLQ